MPPEPNNAVASDGDSDEVRVPRSIDVDSLQTEKYLRDCLATFSRVRLRATGTCMRPVLEPGDDVELASIAQCPPIVGDIVLARHVAGLRLHRLVWGPPLAGPHSAWRTASDRGALDETISPRDVMAKVVSVERGRHRNDKPRRGWVLAAIRSLLREIRNRLRSWLRKTRS
jgi:hypothetical protein